MTQSDYRLLLAADKIKAQRKLFDEYINYVYTIAFNRLRSCGSHEDIDECVSDIFAEVFSSYKPVANSDADMKGFIGTVALRKSAAYYRRLSRDNTALSLDSETAVSIPSPDDITVDSELNEIRRILLRLIYDLGEPDSTIIIQKYYYGRTSREIAQIVPLSPSMIRVRSSRALKKLRRLLEDKDITI
ncbi:MAG: sigma-70 family RNA polymerase sigma factor [Ruminococcus sp.]|nr:sigma-70 family RNA polymerase sigma factor [Ruminococcus sp.]